MTVQKRKFFPKYSTVPYQYRADVGDIVYCTDKKRTGCIVTMEVETSGISKLVRVVLFDDERSVFVPFKRTYSYSDANINKLTCLVKIRPETLHREFTYNKPDVVDGEGKQYDEKEEERIEGSGQ
jgi:hypothetical protein